MLSRTTFSVWRLTATEGGMSTYQDTAKKVTGTLEPVDAEFAALAGVAFGKSVRIFSDDSAADVRGNDRLKAGADEYEVRGVTSYDRPPRHLEIVAEKVIT